MALTPVYELRRLASVPKTNTLRFNHIDCICTYFEQAGALTSAVEFLSQTAVEELRRRRS